MKRITVTIFITAVALTTFAYAAEDRTSDKKPTATKAGPMQPGGMGMMDDKQMAQMQEKMKRMQQQMDRIHQAKDPKERHELMDEHFKTMQENMRMMRGMGGPMMMDTIGGSRKDAMGPGMMGGNPTAGMNPKQQQEFMQRRMDMMQMMMEQVMRHQQMMRFAPAK